MIEKLGSNAGTIYWMEMTFFPLICCINCIDVCVKRPKINEKRSGLAHLKKDLEGQSKYTALSLSHANSVQLWFIVLARSSQVNLPIL